MEYFLEGSMEYVLYLFISLITTYLPYLYFIDKLPYILASIEF